MTTRPKPDAALPRKICTDCKEAKTLNAFPCSRYTADWHTSKCLACIVEIATQDRHRREARRAAAAL